MPVDDVGTTAAGAAEEPAPPVLSVRNIHKVFATEGDEGFVHALNDVSIDVHKGELVCLVGRSGCGKSTLLNIMSGLERPTSGEFAINGRRVTSPQSRDIGYVFQQPVLLPWRSILDNVLLPLELLDLPVADYHERAGELLRLVDLQDFVDRFPHELSGGMQQRAAIVRGLIHKPSILLMDEPFGALDAMTREYMNWELLKIWEQTESTIVFVTHDLRESAFLADRTVVMRARPGSVRAIVPSTLPRPRTHESVFSPEYSALVRALEEELRYDAA